MCGRETLCESPLAAFGLEDSDVGDSMVFFLLKCHFSDGGGVRYALTPGASAQAVCHATSACALFPLRRFGASPSLRPYHDSSAAASAAASAATSADALLASARAPEALICPPEAGCGVGDSEGVAALTTAVA